MKHLYNNLKSKENRRKLRNNSTDAERILWNRLRNRQCNGLRFLRQYGVGNYILDFYCPSVRLCIEIDGGQHNGEQEKYDAVRTKYLERQNIKVFRFWNNDITDNIEGVYEKILAHVANPS